MFDQLKCLPQGKVDILVFTESKLDSSFPTSDLLTERYSKPFRFDRNRNGGGILLYIREDIPYTELNLHRYPHNIEGIFVEVNLRRTKKAAFGNLSPTFTSW